MYFGIAKVMFDWDANTGGDQRDMHNLVESVRKKFKVSAQSIQDSQGVPSGLAIAALHHNENELNQRIDQIVEHCEGFGIGRVAWERAMVEHLDILDELEETIER